MGVFDGHGLNGHLVSRFVMGLMVNYIRESRRFKDIFNFRGEDGQVIFDDEFVNKAIRKCFRYAQDKVKEQYENYLIKKRRDENKKKA